MKKSIGLIAALVVIGMAAMVLLFNKKQEAPDQEKIAVSASFYPLAEFMQHVGGNFVQVRTVVPPGTEPHEYEPTPREIASIYVSRLFVYNGAGIDAWAEKIRPELEARGVVVIDMSQHFDLLNGDADKFDPHLWLDPVIAVKQIEIIRDALARIDPAHQEIYISNVAVYGTELKTLAADYAQGLATCERRDVITSHNAFAYLAKQYGLDVVPIAGLSPAQEPSAKRMAEIAGEAKEKHIEYIFFESLASPKLAQTIAREIGAQTLVFNPLEGLTDEERASGEDYVSVMKKNLNNLRIALVCK